MTSRAMRPLSLTVPPETLRLVTTARMSFSDALVLQLRSFSYGTATIGPRLPRCVALTKTASPYRPSSLRNTAVETSPVKIDTLARPWLLDRTSRPTCGTFAVHGKPIPDLQ